MLALYGEENDQLNFEINEKSSTMDTEHVFLQTSGKSPEEAKVVCKLQIDV